MTSGNKFTVSHRNLQPKKDTQRSEAVLTDDCHEKDEEKNLTVNQKPLESMLGDTDRDNGEPHYCQETENSHPALNVVYTDPKVKHPLV